MKRVVVIAPHPDDETLGCGGSILRHIKNNDEVHWIIITEMRFPQFSKEQIQIRSKEIEIVNQRYGFSSMKCLGFETTKLSSSNLGDLIGELSKSIHSIKPQVIYTPFAYDAHSDHYWTNKATIACSKSFRYPFIERILCYETLSETEFGLGQGNQSFNPNVFINIQDFVNEKIEIMKVYRSELLEFPYPRSLESIKNLASYRGSMSGAFSAESFLLLREII